jgi:hypothetical protein
MFRACFQCATARVKCSGSTPCQRCGIKELQCCYPVPNKKKPKSRKRVQPRETFRANEGNEIPADETIINNLNQTLTTHVSSWIPNQCTVSETEIGIYQMQNHQSQQSTNLTYGRRMIETDFIDNYNAIQPEIQLPQTHHNRPWMRDSATQQPIEQFEPEFEVFPTSLPCDLPTSTTQAFTDINLEHQAMHWLSPPGTSDSQFSFGAQPFDNTGYSDIVGNASLPFEQDGLFITQAPSTHRNIYQNHQTRTAVQVSSPISLQSPSAFASSPGKHHSPATSISPSMGSVCNPEGTTSSYLQSSEPEPHLTVQIPHQLHSASPSRLHSPSNSISPSSASIYRNDSQRQREFRQTAYHQSRSSWDDTRSAPFPSPRFPSTPNRQFQIPISIEKQVLEHNQPLPALIPPPVYTMLMAQFKHYCLKHNQPFLSDYFPSVAVLELSAHLYFEHFHLVFPLLYKSPLDISCADGTTEESMLVLAICAIGVGYLGTADAWQCSEAFLEFFRRVVEDHEPLPTQDGSREIMQLQARILAIVAMFRSPNQALLEKAYEGRRKLMDVCHKGGLLGDMRVEWNGGEKLEMIKGGKRTEEWDECVFVEAKRRAACCIWVRCHLFNLLI